MMKSVVLLYASSAQEYLFEKSFSSKCAFEKSLLFASEISQKIVVLSDNVISEKIHSIASTFKNANVVVEEKDSWSLSSLLEFISGLEEDAAVFSFADLPFLNVCLTKELLEMHEKYIAEYTFADGYPYGFTPEIIDKNAATILLALSKDKEIGAKELQRDSIMTLLKTDINSFEIETLISPKDYRLYRFDFSCETKAAFLSCKALFDECGDEQNAIVLSDKACTLESVLKTVPTFYNIQIESKCHAMCSYCPYPKFFEKKFGVLPNSENQKRMSKENFFALVKKIEEFSGKAVVSISLWGESLCHPNFIEFVEIISKAKKLTLLVETDALLVTDSLCKKVKELIGDKIIWIVSLDAFTKETYKKMRGLESFDEAFQKVSLLKKYFSKTYPQMVRVQDNEEELEQFYRYWNNAENGSGGNLIIQKYDYYSGCLPQKKVADLSPLERNPCWHLRRDMTILFDGSVVPCKEYLFDGGVGNVFDEGIEVVWDRLTKNLSNDLKKDFSSVCKDCDEYYTFNF